jgi:hypothetical protein
MSTLSELLLDLAGVPERATGTFPVELSYDETPPGPHIPADQVIHGAGTIHWGGYFWIPDGRVPSSWPYVTCVAKDGFLGAEFSATRATWPTSWPDRATCSFEGYGLELSTVTVDLVACTTDRCRREDRDASATRRCSFPWNLETGGVTIDGCALPPPPPGQVYDVPDDATNPRGAHWEWSTRRRVGLYANPEIDPVVAGVTCGILLWEHAEAGAFFTVRAEPEGDVRAYCPMRYRSTSTGERWWGPEAILGIDRY